MALLFIPGLLTYGMLVDPFPLVQVFGGIWALGIGLGIINIIGNFAESVRIMKSSEPQLQKKKLQKIMKVFK